MSYYTYWNMSKWEWFVDGFRNIEYIIDCRATMDHFGYDDFWEALSWGWMCSEIFPYDDPYNPKLSKQRKMLYGIR